MFLDDFFTRRDGRVHISAEQGSRFAKDVAGDFNPIHDADAKRFCVPGDLLFALVVGHYGLSERMEFGFRGMVGADAPLVFPEQAGDAFEITDPGGKVYLSVERHGEISRDPATLEAFIRRYAAFSGRNFPEFLEPLMRERQVMFNPDRPLVIYDGMAFELTTAVGPTVDMELEDAALSVAGRRGEERLRFQVIDHGAPVGRGSKTVALGGLMPLDGDRLQQFVDAYTARREAFA